MSSNYKKDATETMSQWNPFEDTTPFNQVVTTEEEDFFGQEFDLIRQEGKQNLRIVQSSTIYSLESITVGSIIRNLNCFFFQAQNLQD